jgi:hypothetical protein
MTKPQILRSMLGVAVPLWIAQLKQWPLDEVLSKTGQMASVVAHNGDALFHPTNKTAEVFNMLAEGIAVLSFVPGGVTAFGDHWETKGE